MTSPISDAQNHASLIDGCRLSRATTVVIPHSDMAALDRALSDAPDAAIVVSEGVNSMSGELCPLAEIAQITHRHGALLVIDDAHGVGTIGEQGRGIASMVPAHMRPDVLIGTASKALGVEGAFVCCSQLVARFVRNRARGYVFSTAASPMTVAAIGAAIEVLESEPEHLASLRANITRLGAAATVSGLPVAPSKSPIFCVRIGQTTRALQIAAGLAGAGLIVSPIRYPTVPRDAAMIRLCLMATHSFDQIDELVLQLRRAMAQGRATQGDTRLKTNLADADPVPTRKKDADVHTA
ncbi:aminotransferase class I/II-fold pyridoxal phosphate-dependent enzyme [Propionibacterium freudenreichii]|uniref:aminotransferase class I/II-fold pyridoxal phosphate-dependent enzyme n=1 Tax=Propionibacterium freudenreichii TaxID=1744 RepID=UPI002550ACEC|nr:aminotransferase class I/II-fold pyridoxal phosphate-dependent enzyme [Propionibacterium freudenreichii]MDK9662137.1 aminotransferase class I/II-fold pyridoxal phosphate-dependent enzyme [Propionibacterium freudenreichii]